MKKSLIFSVLICALSLTTYASSEENTLFQISTYGLLTQGVFDGDYTYRELIKQGDFGIGTFQALDGEMVALDDHFYQFREKGKLTPIDKNQSTPFAEVTHFKPTVHDKIIPSLNYTDMEKYFSSLFPNKNIPYAIRVDGTFKSIKLRALCKQKKPYSTLEHAYATQSVINLQEVKGTLVGFWFPKDWAGIGSPGLHLHFVTANRSIGGHVLELNMNAGKLALQPMTSVKVHLSSRGMGSSLK